MVKGFAPTLLAAERVTPDALLMTTPPEPGKGETNSTPVICAADPLYSRVEEAPKVGATLTVAVPCINNVAFTVTAVNVFAPLPDSVRLL